MGRDRAGGHRPAWWWTGRVTWSRGDLFPENYLPLHEIFPIKGGFENLHRDTGVHGRFTFFKKNLLYSAKLYVLVQYMYNITVV